jgi:hypothetical protein
VSAGYYPEVTSTGEIAFTNCPEAGLDNPCNPDVDSSVQSNFNTSSSTVFRTTPLATIYHQCAAGYRDRLCSLCEIGYYRAGSQCSPCGTSNGPIGLVVVFIIVILGLCLWVLLRTYPQFRRSPAVRDSTLELSSEVPAANAVRASQSEADPQSDTEFLPQMVQKQSQSRRSDSMSAYRTRTVIDVVPTEPESKRQQLSDADAVVLRLVFTHFQILSILHRSQFQKPQGKH